MIKISKFSLLLIFSSVLFFGYLGALYPTIMEARNFVTLREMLASNDFIYTTLNGIPRYEKPPLPTWLTLPFASIFGTHTLWALRLPNALVMVLSFLFFYKLVRLLTQKEKLAYYASFIAASSFLLLYIGKSNVWDTYCYAFMIIALYFFCLAFRDNFWKHWIIASLFLSASFMSKGPMGLLVLGLPFGIFYFIILKKTKINHIDSRKVIASLFLALILGYAWYFFVAYTDYENFMNILHKETEARVTKSIKPWYQYLSFPVQMGVWVIPSILGLFLWAFNKKYKKNKNYIFFLAWTLGAVFLLSLFPEKKERYLMPVLYPLSVVAAFFLYKIKNRSHRVGASLFYYLMAILFIIMGIVGLTRLPDLQSDMRIFSILIILAGGVLFGFTLKKNFQKSFYSILGIILWIVGLGFPSILPYIFNNPNYKEVRSITQKMPQLNLYSMSSYTPEIWYSYQNIIPDYSLEEIKSGKIKANEFLLLKIQSTPFDLTTFHDYKVVQIFSFDENRESSSSNNYSDRKVGVIYRMKK